MRVPNANPAPVNDVPPASDAPNTEIPENPENLDTNLPDQGQEPPSGGNDPNIDELVSLLTANPDRAEGVLKYAKGIIGNDQVPQEQPQNQEQFPEEPPQEEPVPPANESREINLDEITDEILGLNKKHKPTISKPIGKSFSIKQAMFKPSF